MQELDDISLLREYVNRNSEEAFAALVARHVDKVYSVALRHTRNPGHAEEITQAVFVILAKKSRRLANGVILYSWLYKTARLLSAAFIRGEIRRNRREGEAYMQSVLNENESTTWAQIAPLLDMALTSLNGTDRRALVLRFFYGKSMKEISADLGINENATKKRVERALEKLQKYFLKRGVSSTTVALAGTLAANATQAAPAALAQNVTAVALAKGATASASTLTLVKGALKIMAWTTAKTAIVGTAIIGLVAYSVIQHQARAKLREQNDSLQRQLAELQRQNKLLASNQSRKPLRLPAPQVRLVAPPPTPLPVNNMPTNAIARLKGENPKLTHDQAEAYLNKNGRTAANLLAAFRTSGDPTLLEEAMQKYPNDPQVDFEAILNGNLSPEAQRQWLNTFETSAPGNALANYLSALNYFNAGQIDQGVQEMTAASDKPFQDYTLDRIEDDEEAYLGAGYQTLDAEALASEQLLLPQLSQMKQLGVDMVQLGQTYSQAGDPASAQSAFQMAANLGQCYSESTPGEPEVSQLVGMWIEQKALQSMSPTESYGDPGQTVQDYLNQLAQEKATLTQLNQQAEPYLSSLSDQDLFVYKSRWIMFGEQNALQWVVNKNSPQ